MNLRMWWPQEELSVGSLDRSSNAPPLVAGNRAARALVNRVTIPKLATVLPTIIRLSESEAIPKWLNGVFALSLSQSAKSARLTATPRIATATPVPMQRFGKIGLADKCKSVTDASWS